MSIKEPSISKYVEGCGREGDLGYIAENAKGEPIGSITMLAQVKEINISI